MLTKVQLILIRNGFSAVHIYSPMEGVAKHAGFPLLPAPKRNMEVGHYEGACSILINLVTEHVKDEPRRKARWLIDVVFSFGKTCHFKTGQEIHIHVMGSLGTMINMAAMEPGT